MVSTIANKKMFNTEYFLLTGTISYSLRSLSSIRLTIKMLTNGNIIDKAVFDEIEFPENMKIFMKLNRKHPHRKNVLLGFIAPSAIDGVEFNNNL